MYSKLTNARIMSKQKALWFYYCYVPIGFAEIKPCHGYSLATNFSTVQLIFMGTLHNIFPPYYTVIMQLGQSRTELHSHLYICCCCIFLHISSNHFPPGGCHIGCNQAGAANLHGPVENVFPTKVRTLDSFAGAKLRSTCLYVLSAVINYIFASSVKKF